MSKYGTLNHKLEELQKKLDETKAAANLLTVPEDFDWRTAYFELNDKYQIDFSNDSLTISRLKTTAQTLYDSLKRWTDLAADKAPESDLAALKSFDSLMLEIANYTVKQ